MVRHQMRSASLALVLLGCSDPASSPPDARADASPDVAVDAAGGFGTYAGMCGVLAQMQLTGPTPQLFTDTLTFARAYVDPADRGLLTPGGRHLAETPNAGGSSGLSEIFAFEELAHCETASLLKTETEIVYDTTGKITDLEVLIAGHKIGVSVTRAVAFPFGQPYTLAAASMLITRKLQDIQASTTNVSAADKWDKQILAVLAWDDQAADIVTQAWTAADAQTKADTIVIVTVTAGEDMFIYTNQ
jgi:hypothetical protein